MNIPLVITMMIVMVGLFLFINQQNSCGCEKSMFVACPNCMIIFAVLFFILIVLNIKKEHFETCKCDSNILYKDTFCDKSDTCPKCCTLKKATDEDKIKNKIDLNDEKIYCKCVHEG